MKMSDLVIGALITACLIMYLAFSDYLGWVLGLGFVGCLVFASAMLVAEVRGNIKNGKPCQ